VCCENSPIPFIQKPCGKNNVYHQHRFASYIFGLKSDATRNGNRSREVQLHESCSSGNPTFKEAALDSVAPVKIVLTGIAKRLAVKEKKFSSSKCC